MVSTHLTIERQRNSRNNYSIIQRGRGIIADVNWLNVNGVRMGFDSGSVELSGELSIEFSGEVSDSEVTKAAGAIITLDE
jgi:hypothetical protein